MMLSDPSAESAKVKFKDILHHKLDLWISNGLLCDAPSALEKTG